MTDRRRLLCFVAATGIIVGTKPAFGQAFKPPPPDELLRVLRNPALAEAMIAGTSSLRTLLLLELGRTTKTDPVELWNRDREAFFKLLATVRDPKMQADVVKLLETKDPRAYANSITEKALAPTKRMEETLSKGGLVPGQPLSTALFSSFLNINRYLVLQSSVNDAWYCHIYPFSLFC